MSSDAESGSQAFDRERMQRLIIWVSVVLQAISVIFVVLFVGGPKISLF